MNKNLLTKAKKTFNTRGALLIGAAVGSNFLNFVFNAFLGRSASLEEFALISLIVSILALIDIPLGALSRTVTYRSAYLFGKHNRPPKKFWLSVRKRAFLASFGMAFAWVLVTPFASSYFRLESSLPLIFFTPVLFLMVLSAVDSGYLGGNMKWDLIASILVVEAIIKLGTAALLIGVGFSDFAYLSIILSVCVSSILYILAARKLNKGIHIKKQDVTKFPRRFFFSSAAAKISTIIYLSIDVILAKHYLAPEQAGQYALMSLSGKMVFFAGSLFSQFILPVVSHSQGAGNKSRNIFLKLLTASGIASIFAFVVIGAFGHITMPILFGERANAITSYIMAYSLSMVLFTASTNITTFHLLKGRHSASFVACLVSLIQILGIVFFHSSIREISSVMVFSGFLSLALMSLYHFIEPWISILTTNTVDALEPFFPNKKQAKVKGLQILIFNWRDTKHVWSGGAEVYVHQLAKRWVRQGSTVTIFCGNDRRSARNEIIDGVSIVRRGGVFTVYLWAALYYILKFRKNVDIIVDSENGIPFFSPLFSRKPVVLLIHHVHQDIFIEQLRFPFSYIGKFIEGKLMPFVYKNKTIITVSDSTKKEIVKAGIGNEDNIIIVNPGIDLPGKLIKKSPSPVVIYLGRLKAYKNIDVAIKAFELISKKLKSARLDIVGEGDSLGNLRDLALKLGVEKKVIFHGKVEEEEKIKLLSQSWVAIQPSSVEGWGITVLEANACKTPVIASDTKGLRDSVIDGSTGKLVKTRDINAFAKEMKRYLQQKSLREKASRASYNWAKKFDWEKSANLFYETLNNETTNKSKSGSFSRVSYTFNKLASII